MNAYRIQYWIYAVINRAFGQHVKIERDPLHRRYDVNRHGMRLHSRLSLARVEQTLRERLEDHGYTRTEAGYFTKQFGKKRPTIGLRVQKCLDGSEYLDIFLMVY